MEFEGGSTLTDEKRFFDNGDGTVTDKETNLMWSQTDAYQDTSKWSNNLLLSIMIHKFRTPIEHSSNTVEAGGQL